MNRRTTRGGERSEIPRGGARRPAPQPAAKPSREALAFPGAAAPLTPAPGFVESARTIGVEFEPGDVDTLGTYLSLLLSANALANLTAITDPDEAWTRHILDSLSLVQVLADVPECSRVVDVGSGGGLPGVPLAICMPGLRFTLLEATAKKAAFLRHVVGELGLRNVDVAAMRAEAAGRDPRHRERYVAVVARAVGASRVLLELTVPLANWAEGEEPGRVFLIKGQKADEELAQAKRALHELHAAHAATIPTPTGRIVVIEKLRKTPAKYPRRDGEPAKAPL